MLMDEPLRTRLVNLSALLLPVALSALLLPFRSHLSDANEALILVVAVVVIATTGRRSAALVAAFSAAASFDFFLTRPYLSFRITSHADLVTELLLLVVGAVVGDLAARGRRHRMAETRVHDDLLRVHQIAELVARGEEPEFVAMAVATQIRELLSLRDCRLSRERTDEPRASIEPDGTVMLGPRRWSARTMGLPTRQVRLDVRGSGRTLGTFILTPTPGKPIDPDRLYVAVALADQLGAAMAAPHPTST